MNNMEELFNWVIWGGIAIIGYGTLIILVAAVMKDRQIEFDKKEPIYGEPKKLTLYGYSTDRHGSGVTTMKGTDRDKLLQEIESMGVYIVQDGDKIYYYNSANHPGSRWVETSGTIQLHPNSGLGVAADSDIFETESINIMGKTRRKQYKNDEEAAKSLVKIGEVYELCRHNSYFVAEGTKWQRQF